MLPHVGRLENVKDRLRENATNRPPTARQCVTTAPTDRTWFVAVTPCRPGHDVTPVGWDSNIRGHVSRMDMEEKLSEELLVARLDDLSKTSQPPSWTPSTTMRTHSAPLLAKCSPGSRRSVGNTKDKATMAHQSRVRRSQKWHELTSSPQGSEDGDEITDVPARKGRTQCTAISGTTIRVV